MKALAVESLIRNSTWEAIKTLVRDCSRVELQLTGIPSLDRMSALWDKKYRPDLVIAEIKAEKNGDAPQLHSQHWELIQRFPSARFAYLVGGAGEQLAWQCLSQSLTKVHGTADPPALISLAEVAWPARLFELLLSEAGVRYVEERLEKFFANQPLPDPRSGRYEASLTRSLAELTGGISTFWHYLPAELRESIRQHFTVKETAEGVCCSL